eukprot:scaffold16445_cov33-Tisochrysis_lutea.AAC.1
MLVSISATASCPCGRGAFSAREAPPLTAPLPLALAPLSTVPVSLVGAPLAAPLPLRQSPLSAHLAAPA